MCWSGSVQGMIKLQNAIIGKDKEGWGLGEGLFPQIVENFLFKEITFYLYN